MRRSKLVDTDWEGEVRHARKNTSETDERRRALKWRSAYVAYPEGNMFRIVMVHGGIGGWTPTDRPLMTEDQANRAAKALNAEQMLSDMDVDIIVGTSFIPAGKCLWCKKKISFTEAGLKSHVQCGA
jgi:hypothetical protein